ncbi:MAG: type II secretion system inner membrane protein GspF [Candidatus Oxydemutatoraceae bacterium WSBS_2016_MAG_OTU14]
MQTFSYTAYDRHGKVSKGIVEGESERGARQNLRRQGLIPTELAASKERPAFLSWREKLSQNDMMLVTRQLATLVSSGMPLEESLRLMADQAENLVTKKLVTGLRNHLAEGRSLAYALKNSTYKFPVEFIATISAGEETGHLEEVLDRLADDVEVQGKARQSLVNALIYPFLMLAVAVTIVVLLLIYVVPQMTRVFTDMDQDLPALTVGLIAVSEWLQDYGIYLFGTIFGSATVFVVRLRDPGFRKKWDIFTLGVPRIGYLIILANVSGWARSLGMLLESGVPILESLSIAAERVHNIALRESLDEASTRVREGASLHKALLKAKYFPPFLVHMISSGESSGTLDKMLIKVADYYEQRLKSVIDGTLKLFEPMLVIIMGGIVMLIVMAVLVPIIEMNQMI